MSIDRTSSRDAFKLVERRMGRLANLAEADLEAVAAACEQVELHPPGAEIAGPRILVSGWACHRRVLADGARQIFAFLVPGDLCAHPSAGARKRSGVSAVTPCETISAARLLEAAEDGLHHGLAEALDAMREERQRGLLDHLVRLGRLTAYQRMAHLILELQERLMAVGLADERRLPMPLTQETLADALGLSIVHVNRTLQQLRRDGLIELRGGLSRILERETLAEACGYDFTTEARTGTPVPVRDRTAAAAASHAAPG